MACVGKSSGVHNLNPILLKFGVVSSVLQMTGQIRSKIAVCRTKQKTISFLKGYCSPKRPNILVSCAIYNLHPTMSRVSTIRKELLLKKHNLEIWMKKKKLLLVI